MKTVNTLVTLGLFLMSTYHWGAEVVHSFKGTPVAIDPVIWLAVMYVYGRHLVGHIDDALKVK